MRARRLLAATATLLVLGCANAGENRLLTIDATGVVRGFVYFDLNGNRIIEAGDDSLQNITVRLITQNGSDTVATATTDVHGYFRLNYVPARRYPMVADTTPLLDTAVVVQQDSTITSVLPNDTIQLNIGISWPHVTIAQARALPPGRRVFITGIALNSLNNFRDTTVHVQDNTAGIRMNRPPADARQRDRLHHHAAVSAGGHDIVDLRGRQRRQRHARCPASHGVECYGDGHHAPPVGRSGFPDDRQR